MPTLRVCPPLEQEGLSIVPGSYVSPVQGDEFVLPPWRPGGEEEWLAQGMGRVHPHNKDTSVSQVTWPPYFPTSLAVSSSTLSSTWVPSVYSRCSSQTRHSSRVSCSSASSQVRGRRKQRLPCLRSTGAVVCCPLASRVATERVSSLSLTQFLLYTGVLVLPAFPWKVQELLLLGKCLQQRLHQESHQCKSVIGCVVSVVSDSKSDSVCLGVIFFF